MNSKTKTNKFLGGLKNKLFTYLIFTIIVLLFSFIYALLIYYDKLNIDYKQFNTITFIIGIILFLILGFISGIRANKNGLLEGLTAALIIILISLIINLFINEKFEINNLIKLSSYITSSSLGGVIGINLRKN